MNQKFLLSIFFLLLFSVSCIREDIINENLPEFQQKMVVNCLLTPGDSIYAYITKSNPITGGVIKLEDYYVLNASVLIKDSLGNHIELKKTSTTKPVYSASQATFMIKAGQNYLLEAKADGLPSVSAKTTVPDKKLTWSQINSYDILIPDEYMSTEGVEVNGNWTIPNGFTNGYLIYIRQTNEILMNEIWADHISEQQESSSTIKTIGDKGVYINQYEKIKYDGIYVTCSFPSNKCTVDSVGKVNFKLKKIEICLITTDTHLASYNEALEIYSDIWFSKGSFLSQYKGIIPEYTNIEGGLGVFGSYLSDNSTFNIY
jgi:hypothetical protein